jgi:DNA (cytosine-5)-methyltransferase 1
MNPTQPELFEVSYSPRFGELLSILDIKDSAGWPDKFGKNIGEFVKPHLLNRPKTLSLFSGAGGLDIAFHDLGFDIVEMVEIEKKFVDTLIRNTGLNKYLSDSRPNCIDIRDYDPEFDSDIDFIIGGPPCQTFSAAGRRAAGVKGTTDSRGTLFEEYVRLLKKLKPSGFLFENVYGITGAVDGLAWTGIKEAFSEAGYKISFRVLDAADFGVPQHRERMFIVGTKEGIFQFPRPTHGPDSPDKRDFYAAGAAIQNLDLTEKEKEIGLGGRYGHLLQEIPPGLNYSFFTEKMGHPNPIFAWRSKFSDFLYKANPDVPVRTIKAQGGQYTGPFHWDSRPFSAAEMKRLQTFPDHYEVVGNRQVAVHQIGNSVPPQIGRILGLAILEQIFEVRLPLSLAVLEHEEVLGFRRRKRGLTNAYRQTATDAINDQPSSITARIKLPRSRTLFCSVNDGFDLLEQKKPEAKFQIRQKFLSKIWTFDVTKIQKMVPSTTAFTMIIRSVSSQGWALGDLQVVIRGEILSEAGFVAGWKAFEKVIREAQIKADLVQLNGYYQYPPSFSAELIFENCIPDWRWQAIAKVVSGIATRNIMSSAEMARFLDISPKSILELALWMRTLGFEVRNHDTNPQIKVGNFLIPYGFPTLSTSSVQLRKKLL